MFLYHSSTNSQQGPEESDSIFGKGSVLDGGFIDGRRMFRSFTKQGCARAETPRIMVERYAITLQRALHSFRIMCISLQRSPDLEISAVDIVSAGY